jgi:ribosomal protein RSM22 (predicted rRNA methylase)
MDYPRALEDWWIDRARNIFRCESLDQKEAQLDRHMQNLSDLFTKDRVGLAQDYFRDPEVLAAYGLFFFPQSYVRAQIIFKEILSRGWTSPDSLNILDLGAGTGAASLSVVSMVNASQITAVDRSSSALEIMQELAAGYSLQTYPSDIWDWLQKDKSQYDLILASFALNETHFDFATATGALTKLLNDSGLVVVMEPAVQSTSEKLEKWRDFIAEKSDLYIWAPCLHHHRCPLLEEGKFWCHEVRSWTPANSLSFLNRHLYRQIHVLRFSFLVFGKPAPNAPAEGSFRLISPVHKSKKRLVFTGCTSDGIRREFQLRTVLLSEDLRKQLRKLERGDILQEGNVSKEVESS